MFFFCSNCPFPAVLETPKISQEFPKRSTGSNKSQRLVHFGVVVSGHFTRDAGLGQSRRDAASIAPAEPTSDVSVGAWKG